jgi:hypothetical protein
MQPSDSAAAASATIMMALFDSTTIRMSKSIATSTRGHTVEAASLAFHLHLSDR